MVRFYCPGCWADFGEDLSPCPHCGLDIHTFWNSKDRVEKLIIALGHPEPETVLRAAWLLGKERDPRAHKALIQLVERTDDVYVALEGVRGLARIGGPEVEKFLRRLEEHPAEMIRQEVSRMFEGRGAEKLKECSERKRS